MMETVKFSYNWNNKLSCKAFTTFRMASKKYVKGNRYIIECKNMEPFIARLQYFRKLHLQDVNEWVSYIDTGYSLEEFKKIVERMYKEKARTAMFYLILFVKDES